MHVGCQSPMGVRTGPPCVPVQRVMITLTGPVIDSRGTSVVPHMQGASRLTGHAHGGVAPSQELRLCNRLRSSNISSIVFIRELECVRCRQPREQRRSAQDVYAPMNVFW